MPLIPPFVPPSGSAGTSASPQLIPTVNGSEQFVKEVLRYAMLFSLHGAISAQDDTRITLLVPTPPGRIVSVVLSLSPATGADLLSLMTLNSCFRSPLNRRKLPLQVGQMFNEQALQMKQSAFLSLFPQVRHAIGLYLCLFAVIYR